MQKRAVRIILIAVTIVCAAVVAGGVTLCAVFPNKYVTSVNAAADEFGLNRGLVKSVVWAESRFDRKATSAKGAAGLMQLMPETFAECATALGMDGGSDMYGVESSLRCGCYYLSVLIDKFDGNVTAALMAYNAGEANARKFLDGEKVFPETQKYLHNIERARKIYGLFT